MKISVKVIPGASRTEIAGWLGDALKIRVAEPPEKGKANQAVRRILSKSLQIPLDQIKITAGKNSTRKTIEIDRLGELELKSRLTELGI